MNIETAYKLTNTDKPKDLAVVVRISPQAVGRWDKQNIPFSAVGRISDYLCRLSGKSLVDVFGDHIDFDNDKAA